MADERPTLTISVNCPTCGGTGKQTCADVGNPNFCSDEVFQSKCPDCTDGTIRQAVSCAGCKHIQGGRFRLDDNGALYGACELFGKTHLHMVRSDWGCLSWEAREGA